MWAVGGDCDEGVAFADGRSVDQVFSVDNAGDGGGEYIGFFVEDARLDGGLAAD